MIPTAPHPAPTRLALTLTITAVALLAEAPSRADFVAVNFDTTPPLALAPSTFPGTTQDVAIAGVGTFSGGALVGNPTFLASFGPGGGVRNAYGTASFAGPGYARSLTLTAAPNVTFSNVTGTLFNGYVDLVSYNVSAFNGTTLLSTNNFADVGDASDSTGFRAFNLSGTSSLGITRLVVTPDTTFTGGAFDYLLDNVAITYSVVPEPSSAWLLALGLPAIWAARRRRRDAATG